MTAVLAALPIADTWDMHGGDVGTGWMIVMMVGMALFWGVVILGIVWLLRESIGRGHSAADPHAILDRRLAEGEITVKEYEQRKVRLTERPSKDEPGS